MVIIPDNYLTSFYSDKKVFDLEDDNDTSCEAGYLIIQIEVKQLSLFTVKDPYVVVQIKQMNMESCTNDMIVGYKKNVTDEFELAENSVRVNKCRLLEDDSAGGLCSFACRCEDTCTLYLINRNSHGTKLCDISVL